MRRLVLGAAGLLLGVLAVWWLLSSPAPRGPLPPSAEQTPAAAATAAHPPSDGPRSEVASAPESPPAPPAGRQDDRLLGVDPEVEGEGLEAPGDLDLYVARPLSTVPHQVLKGWGANRGAGVGLYVIVAPGLPTAELERLARDIREYHANADSLNVRVVDSEWAATFDRHLDGGELLRLHLVATVRRNERFGVDSIEIRGVPVEL